MVGGVYRKVCCNTCCYMGKLHRNRHSLVVKKIGHSALRTKEVCDPLSKRTLQKMRALGLGKNPSCPGTGDWPEEQDHRQ